MVRCQPLRSPPWSQTEPFPRHWKAYVACFRSVRKMWPQVEQKIFASRENDCGQKVLWDAMVTLAKTVCCFIHFSWALHDDRKMFCFRLGHILPNPAFDLFDFCIWNACLLNANFLCHLWNKPTSQISVTVVKIIWNFLFISSCYHCLLSLWSSEKRYPLGDLSSMKLAEGYGKKKSQNRKTKNHTNRQKLSLW